MKLDLAGSYVIYFLVFTTFIVVSTIAWERKTYISASTMTERVGDSGGDASVRPARTYSTVRK